MTSHSPAAANRRHRLPPPLFDARCKACWLTAGVLLVAATFAWRRRLTR